MINQFIKMLKGIFRSPRDVIDLFIETDDSK